jgi:spore photoproduct lyase
MRALAKRIYAERTVSELPQWASIAERYPGTEWIDDYQSFRQSSVVREKECLIFARKRGRWLKPFHCYHQNPEFSYFSLDIAEGCYFDCVYCYLQSYLNHAALVIFVDTHSIRDELNQQSGRNLWISTGLLTDSFLAEETHPILSALTQWLPADSLLELRTKSGDTSPLEEPEIEKEKVVVSWSLNPESIARNFEYRTASLQHRLTAIRKAIALGYKIGLHLDPVFHFPGWRDEYQNLWTLLETLPKERIAFLSVGLFRYMPELGSAIRKRFPFHSILTGEFFPERDGKYHYFRPIRKEMYMAFSEWLHPWRGVAPVFWSMEPDGSMLKERNGSEEKATDITDNRR